MKQIPKNAIKCLDKGFVRLVDSMGGDDSIIQAARVSYGKGTSKISQDRGLHRLRSIRNIWKSYAWKFP
jgi:thymidylate synthase (FAD)